MQNGFRPGERRLKRSDCLWAKKWLKLLKYIVIENTKQTAIADNKTIEGKYLRIAAESLYKIQCAIERCSNAAVVKKVSANDDGEFSVKSQPI